MFATLFLTTIIFFGFFFTIILITLGKDKIGWSSAVYESYQQCASKARMFNEDLEYRDRIKAVCEKVES